MIQLSVYAMTLSFLTSLLYFIKQPKPNKLAYFTLFLFITLTVEFSGNYLSSKNISNLPLYNIFTTAEFIFYIYTIRQFIELPLAKKIFVYTILAYGLAAFINIFLIQGIMVFHTITYAIGCLVIVFCAVYYFYEILFRPTPVSLVRMPDFWICSGLLFYYAVSFPIYGFVNFIYILPHALLKNFNLFIQILNIILYTMFSIAFLCRFKVTKSPLSLYLEPY